MIRRGYTKYPLFPRGNHCPNAAKVLNITTEDYSVGHRPWLKYTIPTHASLKVSSAILFTKEYHRFVWSSLLPFLLQNIVILWILFPIRLNSMHFFQDYTPHNFTESSPLDLISLSYRKWNCLLSFQSLASHWWSLHGSQRCYYYGLQRISTLKPAGKHCFQPQGFHTKLHLSNLRALQHFLPFISLLKQEPWQFSLLTQQMRGIANTLLDLQQWITRYCSHQERLHSKSHW